MIIEEKQQKQQGMWREAAAAKKWGKGAGGKGIGERTLTKSG